MLERGWVKLYRQIKESWFYKDSEAVHLWIHLLMSATHSEQEFMFNMHRQKLQKGQLITGRKILSRETGISESKIFRLLKSFENEQLIEQQTNSRYSIITIKNWGEYQQNEQQNEQVMNSQRTASEQPVNSERTASEHIQECKNGKNEKNERTISGEISKIDPFINPHKTNFEKVYSEIFGSKPILGATEGNNLVDLVVTVDDFDSTLPEMLKKLKNLNFEKIGYKPTASWFLQSKNYADLRNGTYDNQVSAGSEASTQPKSKLLAEAQEMEIYMQNEGL